MRNTNGSDHVTRRSAFKRGVLCGNSGKEGHTKEEWYQFVGYPPGHPLYGKYQSPANPHRQNSSGHRIVNLTMAQGATGSSTSGATDQAGIAMNARMDQLQNQLNQMMLMMQNNKDATLYFPHNAEGIPKLVASFTTCCLPYNC